MVRIDTRDKHVLQIRTYAFISLLLYHALSLSHAENDAIQAATLIKKSVDSPLKHQDKQPNTDQLIFNAVISELEKNKKNKAERIKKNLAKKSLSVIKKPKKNEAIKLVSINNLYVFPPEKDVKTLGEWVISRKINLTNVKNKSLLRIGNGWYKINNKEWSDKKIEIKENDSLILKHKSSLFHKGETTTHIYINNIDLFTFTSITK